MRPHGRKRFRLGVFFQSFLDRNLELFGFGLCRFLDLLRRRLRFLRCGCERSLRCRVRRQLFRRFFRERSVDLLLEILGFQLEADSETLRFLGILTHRHFLRSHSFTSDVRHLYAGDTPHEFHTHLFEAHEQHVSDLFR